MRARAHSLTYTKHTTHTRKAIRLALTLPPTSLTFILRTSTTCQAQR